MKKLTVILFALVPAFLLAQQVVPSPPPKAATAPEKINWVTIEQALELQKQNPKKIMIDVYTKWCGPCKMLSSTTFQSDDVANYVNANFYAVKFDAESADAINYKGTTYSNPGYNPAATGRNSTHEFSRFLNVMAYPTIVVLDENGAYLNQSRGLLNAGQLECLLKYFQEGHFKSISWNDFQSTFTPSFK
ncbi:MAG: thioredoxin fold domain-containing protein [Flavobacteriales bacterium]|nr:thioredoxin fold domain-containing protein [Flavobacteriales bacterium]